MTYAMMLALARGALVRCMQKKLLLTAGRVCRAVFFVGGEGQADLELELRNFYFPMTSDFSHHHTFGARMSSGFRKNSLT